MNKLLTIILLINLSTACKQTIEKKASKPIITDKQKIADFKNDFMDKVEMYKPDTLHIDTLTFVREKYPNLRLIKTFLKSKNIVFYDYYYNGTTQLENTSTCDTLKRRIGITKQFSKKGKLEYTVDYDKGEWKVFNKNEYPFYDLQMKMKVMADSLVGKMYGHNFLINNTMWSVTTSAIYNENESGNWTDKFEKKPTKFLFRYDVKLDKDNKYEDLIQFELDANGNFIPNQYELIFGFENVPDNLKGSFKLKYEEAIKQAKQLGLTENSNKKAVGILRWENFKQPELINGQFRFYVTSRTKMIENILQNGRSSRIIKYEVYSFNPWTGEFIEKKNMKSVSSWEKNSGSSIGLMQDKQ